MEDRIRTLIVDDERSSRRAIELQLLTMEDIEVVGQAADGAAAVRLVRSTRPDLVFLDIQMPDMDGFQVLEELGPEDLPRIVFVTAHDEFAIRGFDVNAVDYLLKPVEAERLETTVERVRRRVLVPKPQPRLPTPGGDDVEKLLQLLSSRQERREQLAVRVADRFLLVQTDEVVHASVEDDVITVVTNTLSGTSNYRTLDELQARLDPAVFWRVHRSHLVNINRIKEIVPWFSRNYILKMKDAKGSEIPVSRSQTKRLREYLRL